jgi:neutral ceramidase
MAHKYSELPGEDKPDAEHPESPPKRSVWSRISLVLLTPLMLLTTLLVAVGIANVLSGRPALSQLDDFGWFSRVARAPDGQFLLGVGKADTTGYVRCFQGRDIVPS